MRIVGWCCVVVIVVTLVLFTMAACIKPSEGKAIHNPNHPPKAAGQGARHGLAVPPP